MLFSREIDIKEDRKSFDQKRSILVIGKGMNQYSYNKNKILKIRSKEEAEFNYGDSELTAALCEALSLGAINLYGCNCYAISDYVDVIDLIAQYNFEFVVPLFLFSDFFADNNSNIMYLCEFYSNMLNENNNSFALVTDKHASLYENLDQFVSSTCKAVTTFKDTAHLNNGINLGFVANVLQDYKYANVVLATILSNSNFKEYPKQDVGNVVFNLNNFDFFNDEVIYFSYHNSSSIENLLSFYSENDPRKIIPNQIVCNRIDNSFDFSEFQGSLYSAYNSIRLESYVNKVLSSFLNESIESFKITNIETKFNSNNTVDINISLEIKTYLSFEFIDMAIILR